MHVLLSVAAALLWAQSYHTGNGVRLTRIAVPAEDRWESHEFYAISVGGVIELSYRQKVFQGDKEVVAIRVEESGADGTLRLRGYSFPFQPLEWQKGEQLPLAKLGFHAGEGYVNWNASEDAISHDLAFPDWCIPAVFFLAPIMQIAQ
jgi:hypothetical protein